MNRRLKIHCWQLFGNSWNSMQHGGIFFVMRPEKGFQQKEFALQAIRRCGNGEVKGVIWN